MLKDRQKKHMPIDRNTTLLSL